MKNNKVWYIGYLISVVSLIISFAGNHRKSAFIALVIFAAVTFCVTHIMVVHNKMLLKNEEYKIAVNDERTEKIKDKIGTTTSYIMMMFIVISALKFLFINHTQHQHYNWNQENYKYHKYCGNIVFQVQKYN